MTAALVPRVYPLLAQAIHDGALYGLRHLFKHSESPPTESELQAMAGAAANGALTEVCEKFAIIQPGEDA